ncbi:helix-turn-helix domain-containing protein [Flagellimonas flava]|uniref:AraC-type DNA-binding protein n=1 Tax=Flagellimonas flava TaxID=570519 RepID=A0A1M5K022_9FLAO|nr:helix-turn-helix domain-containing protein [Allomuricauda flava]SHG46177.1 AraC-type DNA-binding protein [Allomuricauda flava]
MYLALIVFTSVAASMSFFMVAYLFFVSKGGTIKKTALILLLLAITLRISKSAFYFLLYPKLQLWFLVWGFVGFSMIGPFVYNYYRPILGKNSQSKISTQLLHLVFPVIGLSLLIGFPYYVSLLYLLCLASMGMYLLASWRLQSQRKSGIGHQERKWEHVLFVCLLFLFAAFTLPYIIPYNESYSLGTAIASLVICFMFFFFLKYAPKLSSLEKKQGVDPETARLIIETLEQGLHYREASFSLHSFSEQLGIPKYIITQAIKEVYGKSFHAAINSFRIQDILEKLKHNLNQDDKIETLAYDVGFKNISTFYAVFKKETDMSPREYQQKMAQGL